MSVTDTAATAVSCENCNAPLGRHDACFVWYQRRQGDLHFSAGYVPVHGCEACLEEAFNAELRSRPMSISGALRMLSGRNPCVRDTFCERCGRVIVFVTYTNYPGEYRRIAYCSEACRDARDADGQKTCEVCGAEFTATRRDAKTCSAACKQKAYRQRLRSTA
jgi:hypothetical protein